MNFSAGSFAVKPDKKSEAVTKTAKNIGMIAGGTGKHMTFFFFGKQLLGFSCEFIFIFRHYTHAPDNPSNHERSKG